MTCLLIKLTQFLPGIPGKAQQEGGDNVGCPKLCLAGTLEGWPVFVCPQPQHFHAFLMAISVFSITQEMRGSAGSFVVSEMLKARCDLTLPSLSFTIWA